jgi:hypothetical protein
MKLEEINNRIAPNQAIHSVLAVNAAQSSFPTFIPAANGWQEMQLDIRLSAIIYRLFPCSIGTPVASRIVVVQVFPGAPSRTISTQRASL